MSEEAVAIIGMAVRFPGADGLDAFWRNLRGGVESTSFFSEAELRSAGIDGGLLADPRYVRANGVLAGAEDFDAEFFGFSPREAEITDPQHRLLLELAWSALEHAGYDPARLPGRAGIFAGTGLSTYLLNHLAPNRALVASVGELALRLGNSPDFAPTRVAYKLDLRGPSVAVGTACSTSLVAVHLAAQSLLDFHCDLALAGGVSIQTPQVRGYLHQTGGIGSPDGRCRAFDARAAGTVGGNGGGVVVLRRLSEAIAARDTIHAVIRGSAVNNDGAGKVGFTAPGVEGQARVIAEALAVAGIEPRGISYVEAHGTGTELGDPIEVAALTEAFGGRTGDRGFCALGSVKTNLGHLDEAAGVAGLVKTALALRHRELPPSLHFSEPNPKIDFAGGPFYVNGRLAPWPAAGAAPRRAGVSSFGLGGTNAHVILEEAPAVEDEEEAEAPRLLVLSARSDAALERMAERLAAALEAEPGLCLADAAYTLAVGRKEFERRRVVVARSAGEAAARLRGRDPEVARQDRGEYERLEAAGRAWAAGGAVDWAEFYAGEELRRIPLPGYAFERRRHWVEPPAAEEIPAPAAGGIPKRAGVGEWLYRPAWSQAPAGALAGTARRILWLGEAAAARALEASGHRVTVVDDFARAATAEACERLLAESAEAPDDIVHAWSAGPPPENFPRAQERGYLSMLGLAQALGRRSWASRLTVAASHVADVAGGEPLAPARGTLLGLARVIAQELPGAGCRVVDVTGAPPERWGGYLAAELGGEGGESLVAWREEGRWARSYEPLRLAEADGLARLRSRGVYLITGGLGGVGLIVAEFLARTVQARLVLVSRRGLRRTELALDERSEPAPDPSYEAFAREVDRLCGNIAHRYLAGGAPDSAPGRRIGGEDLRRRLGVTEPFRKFFDYLVGLLERDGRLAREGGDIVWKETPPSDATLKAAAEALAARYPQYRGVVGLLEHCARHYPEALAGRVPAIGVLYPEGRSDLLEEAGRGIARHSNREDQIERLRGLVEGAIAEAGGRPVRILEVGVGDGLLAGRIAPGLKGRGVEYVATDLSRAFVVKAERAAAAAGLDFVSFGVLDISRDPGPQGFGPGSFDLILALDVVHATPRLAETLGHLRGLLAPGGRMAVIEKVRDERWVNLVWGLAEGWWCFADPEWRRQVPLLAAEAWERLLRGMDFEAVTVWPRSPRERASAEYALLLAEKASRRSAAVRRLGSLGAEVMVAEADVADAEQMRAVVERAQARFGALHGVVHAAGLTAGSAVFNLLPEATPEQAEALFRPKAVGAQTLARVLDGRTLDFCVLISSNAAVLGGLGLAAYAASCTHLDLLAAEQRRRGAGAWVSTNWDGWPTEEQSPEAGRVQTSIDRFAMTRAEAESAFARCLAAPSAQVVVSSGDLAARLRRWAAPPAGPAGSAPAGAAASAAWHARPANAGAYVAPRTETERAIAALWTELLGVDPVGAGDNFFDLEGDSLLGTQLAARVGKDLGVPLSVGAIFSAPTVAELAALIERGRPAGGRKPAPDLVPASREEEGSL